MRRLWLESAVFLTVVIAGAEAALAALGPFPGWQWVMVIVGVSSVVAFGSSMWVMMHFSARRRERTGR
jgi:hypothetical protein